MEKTVVSDRKYGPEFEEHVKDILLHPYFNCMKAYVHHGIKRFDHSVRVAYNSFVIAKKLGLDEKAVARGALLHDFFFDLPIEEKRALRKEMKGLKKLTTMQGFKHPEMALENAERYFDIGDLEADIICKHMFPLTFEPPKYSESWIVNGVDTSIAVKEIAQAFFKHPLLAVTGRMNKREGFVYSHGQRV